MHVVASGRSMPGLVQLALVATPTPSHLYDGGDGGCGCGGAGGSGFTEPQPPSAGTAELNAFSNGFTISSRVIPLSPVVALPSMVSNRQVKKQAEVRFSASLTGHSFQHSGRLACTASITRVSAQVALIVRFVSFNSHQQSAWLSPSLHWPPSCL